MKRQVSFSQSNAKSGYFTKMIHQEKRNYAKNEKEIIQLTVSQKLKLMPNCKFSGTTFDCNHLDKFLKNSQYSNMAQIKNDDQDEQEENFIIIQQNKQKLYNGQAQGREKKINDFYGNYHKINQLCCNSNTNLQSKQKIHQRIQSANPQNRQKQISNHVLKSPKQQYVELQEEIQDQNQRKYIKFLKDDKQKLEFQLKTQYKSGIIGIDHPKDNDPILFNKINDEVKIKKNNFFSQQQASEDFILNNKTKEIKNHKKYIDQKWKSKKNLNPQLQTDFRLFGDYKDNIKQGIKTNLINQRNFNIIADCNS